MRNSLGMSRIPREYNCNGNEIFKAEIVIFAGMGHSRGMGMRPLGNGNSRPKLIFGLKEVLKFAINHIKYDYF